MRIKLTTIICLLSVLLLTTSCISDDYTISNCSDKETMQIMFTLSMNGSKTRATTWGDAYNKETANEWENTINQGQLQVLLYDTENKLIGEVENLTYVRHTETENNIYDIIGDLTVNVIGEDTKLNGKLVVLANYGSTVSTTKGDDLEAIKQQVFSYEGINEQIKYIPMWGVHTLNDLQLEKGERADAGIIYMLRAVSKIRVALDDATAEKYTLGNVVLSDYNGNGYCEPSNFDKVAETTELGYLSSSTEANYLTSFNPNATSANTKLPFNAIEDGKSYMVYVPEYAYDHTNGKPTISVTLTPTTKEGSVKTANIELKNYDKDGKPTGEGLDIVRNTICDYTISVEDEIINIQFTCLPWNLVETEIGWEVQDDALTGIKAVLYSGGVTTSSKSLYLSDGTEVKVVNSPSSYTDATKGDEEARYCYVSYPRFNDDHNKLDDQGAGATFYLLLTAPKGAVWKANLTNTDLFEFEVRDVDTWKYKDENNKDVVNYYSETGIARANYYDGKTYYCKPYQIQVKPKYRWFEVTRGDNNSANGLSFDAVTENTDSGKVWEQKYWDTDNSIYSGPYTDLYITVSLDGEHDYVIPINEKNASYYDKKGNTKAVTTFYKDSDSNTYRFAGNPDDPEHYIRIWQLKARKGLTHEAMTTANKSGTKSNGNAIVGNDTFSK